jgi:4-amino-4-deoxy-L-arabinose transferase-like glycosyltransferase
VYVDRKCFQQRHSGHDPPEVACGAPSVDEGAVPESVVEPDDVEPDVEPETVDPEEDAAARVSAQATAATAADPTMPAAVSPIVTAVTCRSPFSRNGMGTNVTPVAVRSLCPHWVSGVCCVSHQIHRHRTRPAHHRRPPSVRMTTMTLPAPADETGAPAPTRRRRPRRDTLGLLVLLGSTALLYLWGLGASGWANAYYSAAVQAGATSWKAMFFGSFDAGNAITVDKTPAALWLMELSVRVFGLSSWSILVPQALAGVAAVGVLYATVRRWFGHGAGLLAGTVLATTPVAVLMFRFNNPDALLVLLLVGAAYAVTRALEHAGTRWLVLAGTLVGFGFLTKMLQAFLVLPAFGVVYLLAAPTSVRRRVVQLAAATGAMVLSAGWWVAIVALTPAAYRPYVGGSQHNSIMELTLRYNGFGRLTGDETGSVSGGNGWGATGLTRMFNAEIGGQVAWLLPAALVLLAAGLWFTRTAARTDRARAAFVLWGGWLLVTAATFSFMAGIFHAYYTIALAPAIGALVGIGATMLWRLRDRIAARAVLAATVAGTVVWSFVLLGRSADFLPWLRVAVVVVGLGAAAALLAVDRLVPVAAQAIAGLALVTAFAGPASYAWDTVATLHEGAIPSAGPFVAGARMGPGGPGGPGGLRGGPGAGVPPAGGPPQGFPGGGGPGPMGGLLNATTPSTELVSALTANRSAYRWVAAGVGANNAAGIQLATQAPVLAIGGFNGSDPAPTLAQFQEYVRQHAIHYFVGSGDGFRGPGGSGVSQQIAQWVAANFTATTIGGVTVYDLTS